MSETKKIIELGRLLLQFARVERVTYHEDGIRPETDSDHTVMLSVISCSIAAKLYPDLDIGKVAQYALVHDLVEVYAGDTPTFGISEEDKEHKAKREEEALHRLKKNFAEFPWLGETLDRYEALEDTESRLVKTIDKWMPKITHILNHGQFFRKSGIQRAEMVAYFEKHHRELAETYAKEFPELMEMMSELMDMTITETFQ